MSDLRYRIAKLPTRKGAEPHWSRPYRKLSNAMAFLRIKLALAGGPYVVNERGHKSGTVPMLSKALTRVRKKAYQSANAGNVYIIRGAKAGYMLRVVDVAPSVPAPSSATPAIQEVYSYVFAKYPDAQNWGICNCRKIAGSSTWSQHSWCNAVDIAGSTALLDRIANDLRHTNLPIAELLWRVPDHYDHIHVTGSPKKGGTPPCA